MAFADFPGQKQVVQLLQRSLERGRLAHAYLFTGHQLTELEALARTLAKTLNCQHPVRQTPGGPAIDCCDKCLSCRKIDGHSHADVHWVRPESKSRVITIDQMRDLMHEINLKPAEAEYKVAVIEAADRLNVQAANAFLKTLEEPPAKSILILLTTDSQRILETILSRCLPLNFAAETGRLLAGPHMEWLSSFAELAGCHQKRLKNPPRVARGIIHKLEDVVEEIDKNLTAPPP